MYIHTHNCIGGVMMNMCNSSVVDVGWARSCQTKDYKIGMCYFSA